MRRQALHRQRNRYQTNSGLRLYIEHLEQ